MVGKKTKRNPAKIKKYKVFHKGVLIGTIAAAPDRVRKLESSGYILRTANPGRHLKRKVITRRGNPKGLTLIYPHVTRIEGTKGSDSLFPGQKFFHNFKRPYPSMYGSADRKTLVIK